MKTTSTPAVEWPPGGAPPTRGTASQGRAATDFGALLDQTSARTAPAEGLKRDGDKTSSVAQRDERRDAAASSRPERPERPEHPHRTDRPERPDRPEHPHAPVAEQAPEQPQGEPADGDQPAPQAGAGEQQPGETVEQPTIVVPIEVANVVPAEREAAPVVAVAAPVAEAPVTSAPVVGPQPVAPAAATPVIAAEHPVAVSAPVATAAVTAAQPAAPAVAEQAVTVEQPAVPVQQQQPAQPQTAQPQQAAGTQQQQQAQTQQAQPQPQADTSAAPVVAERSAEGEQPLPNGQQQATGEQQQQPSADQPANATRARQPQPVATPAESRVQAPASNVIPGVNTPALAEAQTAARPSDAPATRTVRMSPAAEAVENAIRIGQTRGVTHARMSLKPAELGGVEIRLAQTAQGLTATVVADGQQAAQLLQQAGQELRRSLEAQGIQLHQLDISYSGDQREGARSAQAQSDGGDGRTSGGADDSVATDGDGLTTTEDITVKETLELPDGVLVDVLA